MKFKAEINIMTQEQILDPQGKVVTQSLNSMGMNTIENVRIGKHIEFILEAQSEEEAHNLVDDSCKKLLANLIMENYSFVLSAI
jgi:phosphoribosylformylglycinamidine synthase